jgi:hypothetical protein
MQVLELDSPERFCEDVRELIFGAGVLGIATFPFSMLPRMK